MSRSPINIDILYERTKSTMDDSLTLEQIFEKQEKNRIKWEEIKTISQYLEKSSIDDFIFLFIKIWKDKVPDIKTLENTLFTEWYTGNAQPIVRKNDIKDLTLHTSYRNEKFIYESLLLNFSSQQNLLLLQNTIIESLKGIATRVEGNGIFATNSPIEKIDIDTLSLSIIMNKGLATY